MNISTYEEDSISLVRKKETYNSNVLSDQSGKKMEWGECPMYHCLYEVFETEVNEKNVSLLPYYHLST